MNAIAMNDIGMTTARILVLLGGALTANAQIALFTVSGTTETPVTSVYGFGQVAQGDSKDVVFRAKNTGTAAASVTKLAMSGMGFAIVNSAPIPYVLAPGNSLDFTMHFSGNVITSYSANLQVNTTIVLLLATVVAAPRVSVGAPCTGPDSQGVIGFGRILQGTSQVCTFTVSNTQTQALTVSPLSVTGAAFTIGTVASTTIPALQSIAFSVKFTASSAAAFTGTLTAGVRTYTLTGTGFSAPLPTPVFTFDNANMASGEQHTLTVKLPAPSSVAASGTITLGFKPASATVADDSSVQFILSGKRLASFTVAQGATNILINGQPNITFSTGTTAGKLTFSMDAGASGISGDPTINVTVAAAPVLITAASATRVVNNLKVTVTGYDNTYSTGAMTFAFFDRSGAAIGSPISTNLSASFQSFYQGQILGSSFLLSATFPVTGDATLVGGVEVTVANSVGSTRTQRVSFP